jgi:2-phospho-L-lactate guanylyltransferase
MHTAVLIPVKAFADAKVRLAPALPPHERAALARAMGATVIAAACGLPVSVVCDDDEVARWAAALGATPILRPGRGLNGAVADGVAALAEAGADRVIVAHADLPLATDLRPVAADPVGVTLVPDRRADGTNVLCLPASAPFVFQYGPRSFAHHRDEAGRLGLPCRVIDDARLAWDVDVPEDLPYPTCA